MIEGIRCGQCEERIFVTTTLATSRRNSERFPASTPKIIAFENVYSIDAHIAPIAAICDLAEKYGALTYLDEVHASAFTARAAAALPSPTASSTSRLPRKSETWP